MKRLAFLLTFAVMFPTCLLMAGEGMWIPMLLQYNEKEMQEMGMRITADDIYSINHSSLKDAIVLFGGGCTGEIVSDYGLLLTNHHCGYGSIQRHSSVEHDYLTDGFWAMDRSQELPCPGMSVTFLREMRDVTLRVLEGVTDDMGEAGRQAKIEANIKNITAEVEKESKYKVSIKPFFLGNEYYLLLNEVYTDIRLVGCPPSNIGKFGGDTDNWVWPRHTGDFSIFRIYVDKDGNPAEYNIDNVPYTPEKFLSISIKGVEKDDFTFVFGYPARTSEYLTSFAVNQEANVIDPIAVALRGQILDVYNKYQEIDAKVRIQYASKHAGVGNGWKKWMGVTEGINTYKGVERKQAFEQEFLSWCNAKAERKEYADAITSLESLYREFEPYRVAYTYFGEAAMSIELIDFVGGFNIDLLSDENVTKERIEEEVKTMRAAAKTFFKDYCQAIDWEVATAMLTSYKDNQPESLRPTVFQEIDKNFKGDVGAFVDAIFDKTMFTTEEGFEKFINLYQNKKIKKIQKDPALVLFNEFLSFFIENLRSNISSYNAKIARLNRIYMKGQMEMLAETHPEKAIYPDANFTLRVTYGKVGDFKPKDAVSYKHFTTLDGIMQKENPDIYDYVVTDRLRELYEKKDFGRYADADGSMHVCFIAANHTTGGNSGSPILNADGQLLGLNFDRTWEGTMSDLVYDSSICKNISVDVRYVLFLIDKYAGCTRLIEEMDIVEQ